MIVLVIGWIFIFVVGGVLVKKSFPILLYKKKDKDIAPFFRFQFSKSPPTFFGIWSHVLDYARDFSLNEKEDSGC